MLTTTPYIFIIFHLYHFMKFVEHKRKTECCQNHEDNTERHKEGLIRLLSWYIHKNFLKLTE